MDDRLSFIAEYFNNASDVKVLSPFTLDDLIIKGEINVCVESVVLEFTVQIHPHYPFHFHDTETILFYNKSLLEYNHVNANGSICLHTLHCPNLKTKLDLDLSSLKQWIVKYYINQDRDSHYEHIIMPLTELGKSHAIWFTDVDYKFSEGEFGYCYLSSLSSGFIKNVEVKTDILISFKLNKKMIECNWSSYYSSMQKSLGLFYFLKDPPVYHRRFALNNWIELQPMLSQEFLKFLNTVEISLNKSQPAYNHIPVLFGYNMQDAGIHWQAALIERGRYPQYAEKAGPKQYIGKLYNREIPWIPTRNSSYNYFFGRGALSAQFTESKVLILGIGAIGSILSKILTRGGCKNIDIVDHDVKEPENICRSEYSFFSGMGSKVNELKQELISISPFVNVQGREELTDLIKALKDIPDWKEAVQTYLNNYNLILDCTADNDLAYILDTLEINALMINFSITNHAKELVCVTRPNLYNWLMQMFNTLNNDTADLYNPTGCWNPTFKASYNDISVLVNYAVKHINQVFIEGKPLRNFYLTTDVKDGFTIKLNQY